MNYTNLRDMIIDNRNGMMKEVSECKTIAGVVDVMLNGFDWLAEQYISNQFAYNAIKKEFVKRYSENEWNKLESATCTKENLMTICEEHGKYIKDVRSGRKVGYSAE